MMGHLPKTSKDGGTLEDGRTLTLNQYRQWGAYLTLIQMVGHLSQTSIDERGGAVTLDQQMVWHLSKISIDGGALT